MSHRKDEQGNVELLICAEPPPDVGETFAKALAAQLEVKAPLTAGEAALGVGINDRLATAIAPLMNRTQGLQTLRDSAFTLCVDYMNGWIKDPAAYMRIKDDRFAKAVALIETELRLRAGRDDTSTFKGLMRLSCRKPPCRRSCLGLHQINQGNTEPRHAWQVGPVFPRFRAATPHARFAPCLKRSECSCNAAVSWLPAPR